MIDYQIVNGCLVFIKTYILYCIQHPKVFIYLNDFVHILKNDLKHRDVNECDCNLHIMNNI
jgi:hypothetical protein